MRTLISAAWAGTAALARTATRPAAARTWKSRLLIDILHAATLRAATRAFADRVPRGRAWRRAARIKHLRDVGPAGPRPPRAGPPKICVYILSSGGDAGGVLHAELPEDERVVEGDLVQPLVTTALAPVAGGVHVDAEDQRVGVRLERAQLGHVLRGLPVHHLRVVVAG